MPNAPLRYCAVPGCSTLTRAGRCATHAKAKDLERGTSVQRGYDAAWRARSRAFRLQYPWCGQRVDGQPAVMSRCHSEGRKTFGAQVDHVIPHRGNRALFDDERNYQNLCASCGARKTRAGL